MTWRVGRLAMVGLAVALVATPGWAVYKCTAPNGSVVYQDAPCTGKGEEMALPPALVSTPPAPRHDTAPTTPAVPAPTEAPPPAPAPSPTDSAAKTQLELDADHCLDWYKPLLRDPKSAYYSNPSRNNRVVSLDLHTTNGYGGFVVLKASCEIHAGKLNETWTREHARRGGWPVN